MHIHGTSHPTFIPQPQSVTARWPVLISRPAEGRRLSLPGWLGDILRWFARQKTVAHPSTSRGGRESNSRPSSRKFNALTTRLPSYPVIRSLVFLDPRVGHTMDVLSPFISILCHSDWLFHRESCPRLDVVYPGVRGLPRLPSEASWIKQIKVIKSRPGSGSWKLFEVRPSSIYLAIQRSRLREQLYGTSK